MKNIIITGSHPTPAEAFRQQLPADCQLIDLQAIKAPKFFRYDWWRTLLGLSYLPVAVVSAWRQLRKFKVNLVVSFGGYSSVPVCWTAWSLGIPIVIHEQTLAAGLAVKLTAPVAKKIAISWSSNRQYLPVNKLVLTGNPIRQEITALKRKPKGWLYITGGHQGSAAINAAVLPLLPTLVKRFTIYHQYGLGMRPSFQHPKYHAKKYFALRELQSIYTHAQLVVGRAGINTVTELGYLSLPAVLIPLPYTQAGEQDRNAAFLASFKLAVVLPQVKLTAVNLTAAINQALVLPAEIPANKFPRERVVQAATNLWEVCLKLLPR